MKPSPLPWDPSQGWGCAYAIDPKFIERFYNQCNLGREQLQAHLLLRRSECSVMFLHTAKAYTNFQLHASQKPRLPSMTGFHHSEVDRGQPSKDNIDGCLARLGVSELHKEVASPCKDTGIKLTAP